MTKVAGCPRDTRGQGVIGGVAGASGEVVGASSASGGSSGSDGSTGFGGFFSGESVSLARLPALLPR